MNAPRETLDNLVEQIASRTSALVDITAQDFRDAFKYAEAYANTPKIAVSPLPRWAFDKACKDLGVDAEASIAEGKRYGVDAVLRGFGIIFTQRIPQSGVVWNGNHSELPNSSGVSHPECPDRLGWSNAIQAPQGPSDG